jgi:anti-sigma factor RsiW
MMSCDEVDRELVGFQLGLLEDPRRGELEQHLPGCPACVQAFVRLKRAMELAEDAPAPSEASRLALRRAVAAELGLVAAPWRWWERPLALGLGGAAAGAAVLVVYLVSGAG